LLTLSIVDDIVAISVIGIAYSDSIDVVALVVAIGFLAAIAAISELRVWRGSAYVILGFGLWLATMISGVHPTIAGMAAGLLVSVYTPSRERVEEAARRARAFRQSPLADVARESMRSVQRAVSPNERLQVILHPWTSYVIVPL